MAMVRRTFLQNASPPRALGESIVLCFVLALALRTMHASALVQRQALLFIVKPVCALWFALRLRAWHAAWWLRALAGCTLAAALAAGMLASTALLAPEALRVEFGNTPLLNLAAGVALDLGMGWVATVFVLAGVRLWRTWDRLRHEHLIWSLTSAHLTVVLVASLLFAGLFAVQVLRSDLGGRVAEQQTSVAASLVARLVVTALPTVGLMGVLITLALLAVLPPSALFSYWFARRTTRRLESLARATTGLRSGDYATRVAVEGQDEVASLQADFNAMADTLQRTLRELQAERERVAALLRARQELVASVSHELRTPLATLRGYLEYILTHGDRLAPDLQHDLEVIEQETLRLQGLIDDLFALARAEAGGLDMHLQAVDLAAVARRCVETAAPLAWQSSKVQVLEELPASLPAVQADEARLQQVIYNLLRNAIGHTPPGGIVVVSAQIEPEAVMLQVKDTGEGIAAEDLPHVWERFFRGRNARSDDGGAGLGLALVKELCEAMGGSVAAASAPGTGSCFSTRLSRVKG